MGEESAHAGRHEARAAPGLAKYVHVYEEPGRVGAVARRKRFGDCGRAAVDCGKLNALTVPRLERGDQHFGTAFVSAGYEFSSASDERSQVPRRHSGRYGLPWDVADCGRGDRAQKRANVSARDFGRE